jgi:hypothetical protein
MTTTLHEHDLHDLPPLHVTTVGIPPDEHISPHESHLRERELWRGSDRIAWIAVWALVVLLGFFLAAVAMPPSTTTPTGQGSVAWTDYRSGEHASTYASSAPAPNLASPFTGEPYAALPRF